MNKNKPDKQTRLALNYYTKTDTLKYVGAVITVFGLLCLALNLGIVGYALAIIGTPVGIVLFIVGSNLRATDDEMDADIERKMIDFRIEIDNERKYKIKLLPNQKDITMEGYNFDGEVMIKRLASGSLRTDSFTRTKMRILSDRLYIISRRISLISDKIETDLYEPMLADIKEISLLRETREIVFNETLFTVNECHLVITTDSLSLKFPIIDAITSENLVHTLNKHIDEYNDQK